MKVNDYELLHPRSIAPAFSPWPTCKSLHCDSSLVLLTAYRPHSFTNASRSRPPSMITRFLTDVRVTFNPFSLRSKPARLFLSLIPPNARSDGMKIESKMLPRTSKEPASLALKFSAHNLVVMQSRRV